MKRVALCFRGISYNSNYDNRIIDYRKSFDNINEKIIKNLQQNFITDIFLNTYFSELQDQLLQDFKPVSVYVEEYQNNVKSKPPWNPFIAVPNQIYKVCDLIQDYENKNNFNYDYVIITRFDIQFNNFFNEYDINFDKINFSCLFVPDMRSDDNFFLFSRTYLNIIKDITLKILKDKQSSHDYCKYLSPDKCHYICGETSKRDGAFDVMFKFQKYL